MQRLEEMMIDCCFLPWLCRFYIFGFHGISILLDFWSFYRPIIDKSYVVNSACCLSQFLALANLSF